MGKKRKSALPDYIANIRKPLAPPGFSMKSKRDYDRDKEKSVPVESE